MKERQRLWRRHFNIFIKASTCNIRNFDVFVSSPWSSLSSSLFSLHVLVSAPHRRWNLSCDGGSRFVLDLVATERIFAFFRKSALVAWVEIVVRRWVLGKECDTCIIIRSQLSNSAIWHRCNSCVNSFRKANCRQPLASKTYPGVWRTCAYGVGGTYKIVTKHTARITLGPNAVLNN